MWFSPRWYDTITSFPFELQAQIEAQKATQEFQRAVEILRAAKETIALAEERLLEEDSRQFDSAWQEMLNHATQRVKKKQKTWCKAAKIADFFLRHCCRGGRWCERNFYSN